LNVAANQNKPSQQQKLSRKEIAVLKKEHCLGGCLFRKKGGRRYEVTKKRENEGRTGRMLGGPQPTATGGLKKLARMIWDKKNAI